MTEQRYFGDFKDIDDIWREFRPNRWADSPDPLPDGFPTDPQILFASYGQGSYDGDAIVIYTDHETLYEVNASHCSCYGLEGQWKPEETSWAAIAMRTYMDSSHGVDAIARLRLLCREQGCDPKFGGER